MLPQISAPRRFSGRSYKPAAWLRRLSHSAGFVSPHAPPHRMLVRLTTTRRPRLPPGSPHHTPRLLRRPRFLLLAHRHPPESAATAASARRLRLSGSTSPESSFHRRS